MLALCLTFQIYNSPIESPVITSPYTLVREVTLPFPSGCSAEKLTRLGLRRDHHFNCPSPETDIDTQIVNKMILIRVKIAYIPAVAIL